VQTFSGIIKSKVQNTVDIETPDAGSSVNTINEDIENNKATFEIWKDFDAEVLMFIVNITFKFLIFYTNFIYYNLGFQNNNSEVTNSQRNH